YPWSRSRNYYQEIEDLPLFKPVTKFSAVVPDVSRLPDLLLHALRTATAGKPGPVHLELAGHTGDLTEDQELDAEVDAEPVRVPASRSAAEGGAIDRAVAMLTRARRPVIVAGGGVRWSGAGPETVALAERLGAPLATSLNAKDTVPGDHPLGIGVPGLYSRASANQVLMESDLVFYVGSQTGSQVTLNWQVPPPGTAILQLDIDPSELGRHFPHAAGIQSDAREGLRQLLAAIPASFQPPAPEWAARAQAIVSSWRAGERARMASDAEPIRPERLCAELNGCLPADALVVSDTGHAGMWTGGYLDLATPGQGYIRAAGSLGWGLPAAIGAQLAVPQRPVVLFTGDGGLWYHVAELETAARWRVPVTVIVNNNRSLNQEIGPYTEAYGGQLTGRHHELWHFRDVDLAAMAETMGVRGFTVRKASEFTGAMQEAVAHPGPALINVVTDIEAMAPRGNIQPAPASLSR
ncbi:MAG: thiamine pyrophosphate-binding protein, partial [Nocardiopsaceae bacterium]|nr:thiamine pyrophosphate-binding protein [Nocardiopsaceae bacterium]